MVQIRLKSEYPNRLGLQINIMSQQWYFVTQSHSQFDKWESKVKVEKDRLATCDANIQLSTQQMDELQWKIEAIEKDKVGMDTS